MPRFTAGYGVHRDGDTRKAFVLIERTPWWVVAIASMGNTLCQLTRNHSCHHLCGRAEDLAERHRQRFEVPCTPEQAEEMSRWMGWGRPFFVNEDGTHADYGDRYTRMP